MTNGFKLNPDEVDQAGSHVQNLSSKLNQHGSNVASAHQKITASSRSDKSDIGKLFTGLGTRSGGVFSKMFKQLSRVTDGAASRLKSGSKRSKDTESNVTSSIKGIKDPKVSKSKPDGSSSNQKTTPQDAPPPRPKTPPKPNPETQGKIDDHQQKANDHKADFDSGYFNDEEKNRLGKAQNYHQNAADHYQNGDHEAANNHATAAAHQEQANKLHDDAMDLGGKQKQHQTQAANHYEQAADHAANGKHDAANAHVSAAGHHQQAASDIGNKKYGAADRQDVAARHDGLAADHHSQAADAHDNEAAAHEHSAAAANHQQAADHWANNKPGQAHGSAAQANMHAAIGYQAQGKPDLAAHHQGLVTNHQNASNHLNQADHHQQQSTAAQQQGDDAGRLQHQQEAWKQQQLAAHQNGIAHNTHQQLVQQNAGNTDQAAHHGQAVTHHQQQQQQVENYQQPAAPNHTPADPHTAPSVPYQPSAGNPNVYRWDDRPPGQAFSEGMQPQQPSSDHSLYTHTTGKPDTHYVSTSANPAFQWPKQNRYVMNPPDGMHDVNATLGSHSPYPHQNEAASTGGIPAGNIVAAENPTTGEVQFPNKKGTL